MIRVFAQLQEGTQVFDIDTHDAGLAIDGVRLHLAEHNLKPSRVLAAVKGGKQ